MVKYLRDLDKSDLKYSLGNIMFCPANKVGVAEKFLNGQYVFIKSIIFCLEDSILPENVEDATNILEDTLEKLSKKETRKLPIIFIRVRNPEHLEKIAQRFIKYKDIITGFVLPKFDMSVALNYEKVINIINVNCDYLYIPILESEPIIDKKSRIDEMYNIKTVLERIDSICSIMIGGNDICNYFGVRRNELMTIYDINVVSDVISDIINVFGRRYTLIGVIYEFFHGYDWKRTFEKELSLDLTNGFIGKACIHPNQVIASNEILKIEESDNESAQTILNWADTNGVKQVNGRMDEPATHKKWAKRIDKLGKIYGIRYTSSIQSLENRQKNEMNEDNK